MNRNTRIIRTSYIGILTNVLLAGFKATIGLLSNSIAIVLDAVNNISDALSSVITIIGAKLSTKEPDKAHPYGYGRIEYISSLLIGVLVLYAGVTSFVESIKKVMNPEVPEYRIISIVIVTTAVIAKVLLGTYYKKVGKEVNSDALIDSGQDALMDSILSASTVVAAIIFITTKVSLEAYLGVIISLFIVKAGIEMLKNTLSKILGERVDNELAVKIKQAITEEEDVFGAYDLTLTDYGPNRMIGSVHVEVPDYYNAKDIDVLTRRIQRDILKKFGVGITAVGVYSHTTKDDYIMEAEHNVRKIVFQHPKIIQLHGFYLDKENKTMNFDLVVDFEIDWEPTKEAIKKEIKEKYPEYEVHIVKDIDVSD